VAALAQRGRRRCRRGASRGRGWRGRGHGAVRRPSRCGRGRACDRRGAPDLVDPLHSDNPDLGEMREELEAGYNAEPLAIGFNPKYVVELLTQMSSDQITISLGGELDPGLIRPLTGDEYLGVVMPMRI